MGNWNFYQITQLDQVVQPTDSVQALSDSLLTLSKHLVNRIDSIWAARQQAAYFRAISSTPEADPLTVRDLQRRVSKLGQLRLPYLLLSMRYAWVMSPGSTHRGKRHQTCGQQASHCPDQCPTEPSQTGQ